ncbi:MAG: hypothetical protein P1P89_13820 [Desulfobacterales bacterium]|nr:hypothetical protein [Desulfobacterales bacterium]
MPASCEQCQPAELLPGNEDLWMILLRFPGIIQTCPFSGRLSVNYPAAGTVAAAAGILNTLDFYEALEVICKGNNGRKA